MALDIALHGLLLPLAGTSPSGSDLRYTSCYEEIMEARRWDDAVALGDWHHDVKTSDWHKVIELCVAALGGKSKDLQIAVWLTEALTVVEGFPGLDLGLRLITGLVERFWGSVYPLSEDGDLEYRAAPFDFLNEKLPQQVRRVPVTDPRVTAGYCWFKWQESREVGSESDTRNRHGDVDEEKRSRREERIAEQALTAEEFDAAVAGSGAEFRCELLDALQRCRESLRLLVRVVEEEFGPAVPSLADLGAAVEACSVLVARLYPPGDGASASVAGLPVDGVGGEVCTEPVREETMPSAMPGSTTPVTVLAGPGGAEDTTWDEAVAMLEAGQLQEALGILLCSSNGSHSMRDRNRLRLLMAKLCLRAGRADLARPIVEELHGLLEELKLERWESPVWIAEVLETYYQCLQGGNLPDDDLNLSRALFRRICSLDVTKATAYRI